MDDNHLSEDWVEEEIRAALLNVSVDEEDSELDRVDGYTEFDHTHRCLSDQIDLAPSSPTDNTVSNLFTSYLTSLQSQHINTQSILSDAQEVVKPYNDVSTNSSTQLVAYSDKDDSTKTAHNGDLQNADTASIDSQKEVQVVLKELEENLLVCEDQLTREHTQREALLNAKIQENEQKRIEQARIIAEREASKKEKDVACVLLQKHVRVYLARKALRIKKERLTQAALVIQRLARGILVRREFREKVEVVKKQRLVRTHQAAIVIQTTWRGYSCRKQLKDERSKGQLPVVTSGNHGNDTEQKNNTLGKLTVSKRIESSLKALQQQQPDQLTCRSLDHLPKDGSSVVRENRSGSLPLDIPTVPLQVTLSNEHVTSPRKPSSLTNQEEPTEMKSSSVIMSTIASKLSSTRKKALIAELQQQPPTVIANTTDSRHPSNEDNSCLQEEHSQLKKDDSIEMAIGTPSQTAEVPMMTDMLQQELVEEEKALNELEETRAREEMIAQISRERMSQMMSTEELEEVAKRKRAHSTYRHELDHASSPLQPNAWLGLIKERLEAWQVTHRKWVEPQLKLGHLKSQSAVVNHPRDTSVLRSKSFSSSKATPTKLVSAAQLLAASPKGISLEEATHVVLYRPRAPIDMTSFSKCPKLCSISLNNCGVVSMETLEGCGQLTEISMQCNMMEHVNCSKLNELKFADFSNNRIASIHGYENCCCLLELNLSENRLARVSGAGMKECQKLQRLNLDGNLLINCKGVEQLPLLQHLSCCENHLPIVDGLEKCSLLQSLLVSQNNLQQVPQLCDHVLLRELHLDENSLSTVEPITQAWLPLLQTLSLANNCIVQLEALACLVMLQTLDVQNNTIYDLPVLLQAIRGCFQLRHLRIHGNPVTEERKFKMYLAKALPNLETLDESPLRKTKTSKTGLPDIITACPVLQICSRQIVEQDNLKQAQEKEIDELAEANSIDPSPGSTVKILQTKVSHRHDYQKLLIRHLREHEMMSFGTNSPTKSTSKVARKKAAILIQSVWKGNRVRVWYKRERRKRQKAATVIQAYYKGYVLRKRLRAVLTNAHLSDSDDVVEDHVNYDEDIPTDYLNESLLNFDLQPLSPTDAQLERFTEQEFSKFTTEQELPTETGETDTPIFVPAYTIPGGVDDVITFKEWKFQNQPSIQSSVNDQVSMATNSNNYSAGISSKDKTGSHSEITESHSNSTEYNPGNRVQLAWVTSDKSQSHCGWALNRVEQEESSSTTKGQSTIETIDTTVHARCHGNSEDVQPIENDWGFKSSMTADLMRRRAHRQRKMQTTALKRKKLADPMERLAMFRKHEIKPITGSTGATTSPFEAHSTPDLTQEKCQDDFLYQWVHHQRIVHGESDHSQEKHQRKRSHSNSSLLPHLEPHVLAGHTPRLVSSGAQNQLVQGGRPKKK